MMFENNNIVVLSGVGGIGKTEIAKEFARTNKEEFTDSYLMTYALPPHTDTSDGSIAYDVKDFVCSLQFEKTPNTNNKENVYLVNLDCLHNINRKTLLIIDGYDIGVDQVKNLKETLSSCSCRFLFTSRHETYQFPMKKIGPMSDVNIVELFKGYYSDSRYYNCYQQDKIEIDDNEILNLAKLVDYHTLTITLMVKLLRMSRKVDIERLKNVFNVKSKIYYEKAL